MVSFILSRSYSKPQSKLFQSVRSENLKCGICSQYAKSGERKKFRISEELRAEDLQKASSYFKDEIYIRIADQDTPAKMFVTPAIMFTVIKTVTQIILGNVIELLQYLIRQQKQYFPFIKSIIDQGRGFSLSDIRTWSIKMTMLIWKNGIKGFLIEKFGDLISFCDPERKNQSLFSFFINSLRCILSSILNIDVVKTAPIEIRKSLLDVNFGIENSFCDANQLK